jgi:hypothetical protein
LGTGKEMKFGSLRKTYISNLAVYFNNRAKAITTHSSDTLIDWHYLDKKVITKSLRGFKVFPEKASREDELVKLRDQKSSGFEIEK